MEALHWSFIYYNESSNFRDSPNDTACKLVENRSSKEVVGDPLIPCFFLPRQFLQCNEPVGDIIASN